MQLFARVWRGKFVCMPYVFFCFQIGIDATRPTRCHFATMLNHIIFLISLLFYNAYAHRNSMISLMWMWLNRNRNTFVWVTGLCGARPATPRSVRVCVWHFFTAIFTHHSTRIMGHIWCRKYCGGGIVGGSINDGVQRYRSVIQVLAIAGQSARTKEDWIGSVTVCGSAVF